MPPVRGSTFEVQGLVPNFSFPLSALFKQVSPTFDTSTRRMTVWPVAGAALGRRGRDFNNPERVVAGSGLAVRGHEVLVLD
jgi:hypothetical protein